MNYSKTLRGLSRDSSGLKILVPHYNSLGFNSAPIKGSDTFFLNVRFGLPFQPVDATHAANRSAGVSKSNVFLGRSSFTEIAKMSGR